MAKCCRCGKKFEEEQIIIYGLYECDRCGGGIIEEDEMVGDADYFKK